MDTLVSGATWYLPHVRYKPVPCLVTTKSEIHLGLVSKGEQMSWTLACVKIMLEEEPESEITAMSALEDKVH